MSAIHAPRPKQQLIAGRSGSTDILCTGTNDYAALNSGLSSLSAGGEMFVGPGNYAIDGGDLAIANDVIVTGCGYGTLFTLSDNRSISISAKSNVTLRNLRIDASAHTVNDIALLIANVADVTIENCWILNCEGFGIFVSGTNGTESGKIRILNNRLSGRGNNDVLGGGPANATSDVSELIIQGNYIQQDFSQGNYRVGLDIVSQNKTVITNNILQGSLILGGEKIPHVNVTVANNLIRPAVGATYAQLAVLTASNAGESDDSYSINLISNQITDGHIYVQGQSSTSNRTRKVNISKNNIKGLKTDPTTEVNWAINLNYLADVQVEGNIVDGSDRAIYINGIDGIDVSTNRFINCNSGAVFNGTNTNVTGNNNVGINPDLTYAQGNVTGATTFNRANGSTITATLTGNITVTLTAGVFAGDILTLKLTQDGTGSRTVTWPSNFKKAGGALTLSTGASAVDVIEMRWDGQNWIEASRALNVS